MQKSMSKKYRKIMPKVTKNDAKIDTKINQFSNFSENSWNARNYLFYNRKRGSEHVKMQEKTIQNQCKIDEKYMPDRFQALPGVESGFQDRLMNRFEVLIVWSEKY
mgnify:CR=1 FL=1